MIENYLNLITSEYRDKTKYIQWMTVLLQPFVDIRESASIIKDCLNLNYSTGDQLDMIGEILGLSRQVNFQPSEHSSILDDDYYRIILKAKVAKNQWDGTKENLYSYWRVLFPENPLILVDRQNMTIQATVIGLNDTLSQELISHGYIIPKPAGVGMEYAFEYRPLFAQDFDTEWLKGFDEGYWAQFIIGA